MATAAEILDEAANDIIEFGWVNYNNYSYDPTDARCIWRTLVRAADRQYDKNNDDKLTAAEDALLKVTGNMYLSDLFNDNDSREQNDDGRNWAYNSLIAARDLLEPDYHENHPIPQEQNWFTRWVNNLFSKKN